MKIRFSHLGRRGLTRTESLVLPSAESARVLSTSRGQTIVRVVHIRKASVRCVGRRFWTPKTTSRPLCDCTLMAIIARMDCACWRRSPVPPSSCASSTVDCVCDTAVCVCVCFVHERVNL
ncbi:hypothetical protein SKAU_G00162530 [Synaphobranchus kaupii]|uniref:Uncharacterized protein n=1 Tax=Synaphobranchus kaupii TaxID=118154 RepID=A0A9Q1FIZ3_SYNKA|nr:hypothetical protein SKAU_G00162530 [Synaphobranchus kaupii]